MSYSQRLVNLRHLQEMVELKGRRQTLQHLTEALEKKHLSPWDFSIRELAQTMIPNGKAWVSQMARRRQAGMPLTEAAHAVDTGMFSNITGQIVYNALLPKYEAPEFIWPECVTVQPTTFQNGERIAGIGGIGNEALVVDEGQPYPKVGVNEAYVDTPVTKKYGFIVPVTKEAIIADRTGDLLNKAGEGAYYLGINVEKNVLRTVLGVDNTYRRNGSTNNTYLTSGAYINSQSNTLVDHTDLENAELLLAAITDPNTGLPIMNRPDTWIVPLDLKKTALRILNATSVAVVDNSASAGTARLYAEPPKPLYDGAQYKLLSNVYVKDVTSSGSTWFLGRPKDAFKMMQVWALQTQAAPANSYLALEMDVIFQSRVDTKYSVAAVEPRFMAKNT